MLRVDVTRDVPAGTGLAGGVPPGGYRFTRRMSRVSLLSLLLLGAFFPVPAAPSFAATSHAGWPHINGMLLMNKLDQSRPLDARPGRDPFGGQDPDYSCDGIHQDSTCVGQPRKCMFHGTCRETVLVPHHPRHNKLLGGHGNDRIHAGPWGDVLWGDYKPRGQPTDQVDRLYGGRGRDFIYASHGKNIIRSGGGRGRDPRSLRPRRDLVRVRQDDSLHQPARQAQVPPAQLRADQPQDARLLIRSAEVRGGGLPAGRAFSVWVVEVATFKLDDPDVVVRAALACPYCLSSDQGLALREGADEFSLRCSCRTCGRRRRVEMTDEQALRIAIAPPT